MSLTTLTALTALLFAQDGAAFEAYVEPSAVEVGGAFEVGLRIGDAEIEDIRFPDVEGADPVSGVRVGTHITMQRGAQSRRRTVSMRFRATRPGLIIIPPITLSANGQTKRTEPITVTARERAAGDERDLTWDDVAFLEARASSREAYAGEGVRLVLEQWEFNSRNISVRADGVEWPSTEGFVTAPDAPVQQGGRLAERNGRTYEVKTFAQYLYPPQPGVYEIGPWRWTGTGRQGRPYATHRFNLTARPISIRVKALPKAPPGFTGTVGTFEFDSRLGSEDTFQGASVPLVIVMRGHGNPRGIAAPQFEAPPGLRISEPTADTNEVGEGDDFVVEKRFTYALLPTASGEMRIPAADYVYFDPSLESYRTARLGPFSLNAAPASPGPQSALADSGDPDDDTVRILHRDIRPPMLVTPELEPRRSAGLSTAAAFAAPPALYAAAALLASRRRRFASDTAYARSYRARRNALKELAQVPSAGEPAQAISHALTRYAAAKFGANPAGLTSREVRELLQEDGLEPQTVTTYMRILEACERARYASGELNRHEVQALVEAAHGAVDQLEAQLGKGGRT